MHLSCRTVGAHLGQIYLGNLQYISTGNLAADERVALFAMITRTAGDSRSTATPESWP